MADRWWLLTSTTYGSWLPGDSRSFVGTVRGLDGESVAKNIPETPYALPNSRMVRNAAERMVGEAVLLTRTQAVAVLEQFEETSAYRSWQLAVAAVMANHFHAVVGVGGDPESETLLRDLKSYASRRLNREFGRREWWTKSGSKRKLPDEPAVIAAVRYVREQKGVLASFTSERWA